MTVLLQVDRNKQRTVALLYMFRGLRAFFIVTAVMVPHMQNVLHLDYGQILSLQAINCSMVLGMNLVSGYLSDHFGYRPSLMMGGLLIAVCYMLYAVADGYSMLVVAEVLSGMGGGFIYSAQTSLAHASLPEKEKQGRRGGYAAFEIWSIVCEGSAQVIASLIGNQLKFLGAPKLFAAQAVVLLGMIVAAWFMHEPERHTRRHLVGLSLFRIAWGAFCATATAIKTVRRDRRMLGLVMYTGFAVSLTHCAVWIMPFYVRAAGQQDRLGVWWAVMVGAWAIAALAARQFLVLIRRWFMAVAVGMAVLGVAAYVVAATVQQAWLIGPIVIAFSVVRGVVPPLTMSYLHDRVSHDMQRATTFCVQELVQKSLFVIGMLAIGGMMNMLSFDLGLLIAAGGFAVLGVVALTVLRVAPAH